MENDEYTRFSTNDYLQEYYSTVDKENDFIMNFLHQAHMDSKGKCLLEFGGGPTIYQLISATAFGVKEIVFAEYLSSNRQAVRDWKECDGEAFDWSPFFHWVTEHSLMNKTDPTQLATLVREKIKAIINCDVWAPHPIDPAWGKFDLVSVNFVVESITDKAEKMAQSLGKISDLVAPNGKLILTALRHASYYTVGRQRFATTYTDEDNLVNLLERSNLKVQTIQMTGIERYRGYDGIIGLVAKRL